MEEIYGKKIILINPSPVIRETVIPALYEQEYEVYFVLEIKKAFEVIRSETRALFFLCLENTKKLEEWKKVSDILFSQENARFGIIATTDKNSDIDDFIKRKDYPLGIVRRSPDYKPFCIELLKIFQNENCKGRRKFVRTCCKDDSLAKFFIVINDKKIMMDINDLSSVGMCCKCLDSTVLPLAPKTKIQDAQISLRGIRCKCDVIVYRVEISEISQSYIFLFTQDMDDDGKQKIREYIRNSLQNIMDAQES